MDSGIYEIVNTINGHRYVGSTNNFRSRWKSHRYYLRHGKYKTSRFQRAWDLYGEEAFDFRIITCIPIPSLLYIEQKFLDEEFGEYNSCPVAGDTNRGRVRSEEERAAISARMMGNQYGKGWHPTEEQRAQMSKSRMGNTYSLGFKQSEETKRKRKVTQGGINHPCYGKPKSEETKRRISESLKLRAQRLKEINVQTSG